MVRIKFSKDIRFWTDSYRMFVEQLVSSL